MTTFSTNSTVLPTHDETVQKDRELGLTFILFIVVSQILVVLWKNKYPKAYQTLSLYGLWLIPPIIALNGSAWRFLTIWFLYSALTWYVMYPAFQRPLDHSTPRRVFTYFKIMYKITFGVGLVGFVIFLIEFFGIIPPDSNIGFAIFEFSVYLLFYGLYFGLLGRDSVQECSDRMAANVGYYNPEPEGLPNKSLRGDICAICGHGLSGSLEARYEEEKPLVEEETIKLKCGHKFHEFCIHGWCILGKKDMCPYCKEKVDLRSLKKNHPWETQEAFYLNLLDSVRYTLVFQPIVIFAFKFFADK